MNQSGTNSFPKIGKFKASFEIVKKSWAILNMDKEVMWFPVLSFIANLILNSIFVYVLFFSDLRNLDLFHTGDISIRNKIIEYIIYFVYYLLVFLITNYFITGIYLITNARINGKNLSFSEGIKGANKYFRKIFIWSLISSTVGLILRIISDKSKLVGKIVVAIFGAAWNVVTFFSLPSMIVGNKSIKESFKESANIINNKWGEVIIVNFGVGLYFLVAGGVWAVIAFIIISSIPVKSVYIAVIIISIIIFISFIVLSSALNSIFKVILYDYAKTGKVAEGFTKEILEEAIEKKK